MRALLACASSNSPATCAPRPALFGRELADPAFSAAHALSPPLSQPVAHQEQSPTHRLHMCVYVIRCTMYTRACRVSTCRASEAFLPAAHSSAAFSRNKAASSSLFTSEVYHSRMHTHTDTRHKTQHAHNACHMPVLPLRLPRCHIEA